MSVYNPDKATKAAWAALVEKQTRASRLTSSPGLLLKIFHEGAVHR